MLDQLARALPRLYAPIMPFLAEEVFASYSQQTSHSQHSQQGSHSVFEEGYVEAPSEWRDAEVTRTWRGCAAGR